MNKKPISKTATIVLTGGGTGGHIYPNLALIPTLKKYGFNIVYFGGTGETLERRLVERENNSQSKDLNPTNKSINSTQPTDKYKTTDSKSTANIKSSESTEAGGIIPYYGVPNVKFVRTLCPKSILANLKIPSIMRNAKAIAAKHLKAIAPAAVFSKGGYVSLPVTLAALELGIPVFCHESDLTQGLANKVAAKHGAVALKCNPHSTFNATFVGMPLREQLFSTTREQARHALNLRPQDKVLLIVGGSSGATALNDAATENLSELTQKYHVIHITGKGKSQSTNVDNIGKSQSTNTDNIDKSQSTNVGNIGKSQLTNTDNISNDNSAQKGYKIDRTVANLDKKDTLNRTKIEYADEKDITNYTKIEYADNIELYLHAADVVVSRAGATAVFELSALRCRALFIPLPKGVSRGDQVYNAELAKEYGGHVLLQDKDFKNRFTAAIDKAYFAPPMKIIENDANRKIAEILCASIRRGNVLCNDKKTINVTKNNRKMER